jgi:hypothetical protein
VGIVLIKNKIVIKLTNRVPDEIEDIRSHRSEIFGIQLAVKIIQLSIEFWETKQIKIQQQNIKLICDNKTIVGTVKNSQGKK